MNDDALSRLRAALAVLPSVIVENENGDGDAAVLLVRSVSRSERLVRIRSSTSEDLTVDPEDISFARSDWIDHVARLHVSGDLAARVIQIWLTGGDVEDCIAPGGSSRSP